MAFDRLICMPLGVGASGHDGPSCCNHVLIISQWTWHSTRRFIKYLWRIICMRRVHLCVCARDSNWRSTDIATENARHTHTHTGQMPCDNFISLGHIFSNRHDVRIIFERFYSLCIHSFCFDWRIGFIKNWSIESIWTLNNFALLPVHFFIARTL